ncbi:MAG TPA: hypothetical protein VGG29_05455 [Caulobacteraceae bacterium]|jgi:hypothetical protein
MRRAFAALTLLALPLCACTGPGAPEDSGVCWQTRQDAAGKLSFTPLAREVANMETCSVLLEGLRLKGAPEVDGAYQGYFIFVDARAMTSGRRVAGLHYPIFQPPQRAEVDRDLQRLMKERGGKLPDPGEISLERDGP